MHLIHVVATPLEIAPAATGEAPRWWTHDLNTRLTENVAVSGPTAPCTRRWASHHRHAISVTVATLSACCRISLIGARGVCDNVADVVHSVVLITVPRDVNHVSKAMLHVAPVEINVRAGRCSTERSCDALSVWIADTRDDHHRRRRLHDRRIW